MKMTMYSAFFLLIIFISQANSQISDFSASRPAFAAYQVVDTIGRPQKNYQNVNIEVPPQKGGTLVLECLGGAAGGFCSILAGTLISLPLMDWDLGSNFSSGMKKFSNNVAIWIVFASIGYDFAVPWPITVIGNTERVKGDYGSALLGSLLGNCLSIGLGYIIMDNDAMGSLMTFTYIAAPIAGGMIGYSLSRHWDENYLKYMQQTDNLEKKQAMYSNSLLDRISIEGMSLSIRQNPFKITPEPMTYVNILNVKF